MADAPAFPSEGSARLLLALRHALADPLSSVSLKLDLVGRRLATPAGADPDWVQERIRAAQTDLGTASRLIDLLVRLAEIAEEPRAETSLRNVCETAGVELQEPAEGVPVLTLRVRAAAEAVRDVAGFAGRGDDGSLPTGRARVGDGSVSLLIEGSRPDAGGRPERLLDLPHGVVEAEALFVARAAVEADGGRLELTEKAGRLVARLSWPDVTS